MKYNVRKNWLESLELITKNPVILMPFIIIAFLEALALEGLYFASRKPLVFIGGPIMRKFFGEQFLHYPGDLLLLPRLFYYKQISIYILFGVFLTAISINIFKNIKSGLPVKTNALTKNAFKKYFSFFIYGTIIIVLIYLLKNGNVFILTKASRLTSRLVPQIPPIVYELALMVSLFLTNVILQVFFILTIPIIVIGNKSLLKSLLNSIALGARNFFVLFKLIFLPFLIYFPIMLLKTFSNPLIEKTCPEMNLYLTGIGILASMFLDAFMILCASQFFWDKK